MEKNNQVFKGIVTLGYNSKEINKSINKLNYNKNLILKKSIECFNDNDPCIIHKTYCINYLSIDLLELLETNFNYLKNKKLLIKEIPNEIVNYLELDKEVVYIKLN